MSLQDSVGEVLNIRLAWSPAREYMMDPNNEYMSDQECCEAPKPLIDIPLDPPVSCDLLYPKWNSINKDLLNFTSLPSTYHVSSCIHAWSPDIYLFIL
jgi:hypothetical protein